MIDLLLAQLTEAGGFPDESARALADAVDRTIDVEPNVDIVTEGGESHSLHVMVDGWACRYRLLPDGRRQIPALLLPGDIADLDGYLLPSAGFGVAALTGCRVAVLPHRNLARALDQNATLRQALWRLTSIENSAAVQWTVCLGAMSAEERLAHLLCELSTRLAVICNGESDEFPFPITQQTLADALGLSSVHVNRMLHELKSDGLASVSGRKLIIHNRRGLAKQGLFDPEYLHRTGRHPSRPGKM